MPFVVPTGKDGQAMAQLIPPTQDVFAARHLDEPWPGGSWPNDSWSGWPAVAARMPSPDDETVPLFDASTLTELCADLDPEILAAILVSFVEDIQERLERIATAAASANLRVVAFESHALSGCSETFGALRLATVCRHIEHAVDDGDQESVLTLARSLGQIGAESLGALSAYTCAH